MAGLICLQGGREFTPPCRPMDAEVLTRADAGRIDRPVAVLSGAARVGEDYRGASGRATAYYRSLGAHVETIPDPRDDLDGALDAMHDGIGLLVLPGGSPSALLDVLLGATPRIGARTMELHRAGTALSGASAGAMVLAEFCLLPDQVRGGGVGVAEGLGLAEGLVLPHWRPDTERWQLPEDVDLWGLPECGGVLIGPDGGTEAVGEGVPSFRVAGAEWLPVVRGGTDPTLAH